MHTTVHMRSSIQSTTHTHTHIHTHTHTHTHNQRQYHNNNQTAHRCDRGHKQCDDDKRDRKLAGPDVGKARIRKFPIQNLWWRDLNRLQISELYMRMRGPIYWCCQYKAIRSQNTEMFIFFYIVPEFKSICKRAFSWTWFCAVVWQGGHPCSRDCSAARGRPNLLTMMTSRCPICNEE